MTQRKPIGIRIYELRKGNSMTRKSLPTLLVLWRTQ